MSRGSSIMTVHLGTNESYEWQEGPCARERILDALRRAARNRGRKHLAVYDVTDTKVFFGPAAVSS